ncbi:hypothetical protein [Hyphomonas pacifica]|uniref:Major tropism determinant N-terminal domain-containing protein n=1 Tax=Hyphomonas pacifica TaxID=1280941 RepID=A0A8B2PKQ6_9PROT|nr:hypothetical protein [Hyphomonas pacifica]RAN30622.1 hypothetical protein HY3_05590 [Hyphomonas pacifica]
MAITIRVKRRTSGDAGAPASLKSGELAWNQVDNILYAGFGDDGSGEATSIVPLGGIGYFAKLASPEFTGTPTAPTPPGGNNSTRIATTAFVSNAMAGAGTGDMLKSVYDPNDDGKVTAAAAADSAPWSGITGKPSEFTPENFDASKIITGIVDPARLPAVLFASPVVSSGGIADLTTGQQEDIAGGTSVVTSDGREWRYTGAGDKTLEASYVEMADRTPDWSAISNKPGSYPPSAHTHTLSQITDAGSMAAQNAAAIAVTGGTMSGVTLDGMTVDGGTF